MQVTAIMSVGYYVVATYSFSSMLAAITNIFLFLFIILFVYLIEILNSVTYICMQTIKSQLNPRVEEEEEFIYHSLFKYNMTDDWRLHVVERRTNWLKFIYKIRYDTSLVIWFCFFFNFIFNGCVVNINCVVDVFWKTM